MRLLAFAALWRLGVAAALAQVRDVGGEDSGLEERGFSLGALGLDTNDLADGLTTLINATSTVLIELIDALKDGAVVQNGLGADLGLDAANKTLSLVTNTTVTRSVTCPDMAVIFARGTTEPGNVGFLAGPPFFEALQTYNNGTHTIAVQGIDYPASVSGFLAGGDPAAAAQMALLANATQAACPGAKLVLSGYSQGAQVVHLAAASLSPAAAAGVSSVVLFGDPRNGSAVAGVAAGRTAVFCHAGDDVCRGGDLVLPAHLNYSLDAAAAAMFAMQKSGLGLASSDATMQGMENTIVGKAMKKLGLMS